MRKPTLRRRIAKALHTLAFLIDPKAKRHYNHSKNVKDGIHPVPASPVAPDGKADEGVLGMVQEAREEPVK